MTDADAAGEEKNATVAAAADFSEKGRHLPSFFYILLLKYSLETCNCFFRISFHTGFGISPELREIFVRLGSFPGTGLL